MKSDCEFARETMARGEWLKKRRASRKQRVVAVCAVAVSFFIIVGFSLLLPAPNAKIAMLQTIRGASIFASGEVGGYVIIGVVGFVLGVAVVLLYRRFGGRD